MIEHFLIIFYMAIPAFMANMVPVIGAKLNILPSWDYPIDFHKTLRGKPITGTHKTFRGLFLGICLAMFLSLIQYFLHISEIIHFFHIDTLPEFLVYGFLSGFGALIGDMLESIVKRQIGIKSGRPFIPFDQIDYIFGFVFATWLLLPWAWQDILFLLVCGLILNPLTNIIGYLLGIKKTFW